MRFLYLDHYCLCKSYECWVRKHNHRECVRHHCTKNSSKYTCWASNWHVHSDLRRFFIKSPGVDAVLETVKYYELKLLTAFQATNECELVSCLLPMFECLCKTSAWVLMTPNYWCKSFRVFFFFDYLTIATITTIYFLFI